MTPKTEGRRALYVLDSFYDYDEEHITGAVCELEGYPEWRILPEVDVTERGLILRRLVIQPAEPGPAPEGGIQTRMLRQIRTGDLLAAIRVASRQTSQLFGTPDLEVARRPGRRGRDERYYAGWAAAYADALTRSGRPIEDLATLHQLSPSQVRNLVHACRRRGMLTASPRGRAGGELTPRAVELLVKET